MGGLGLKLALLLSAAKVPAGGGGGGSPPDLLAGAGAFASASGWTLSGATISGGKLRASGGSDTATFTLAGSPLTADVAVFVSFTVDSISAGNLMIAVGNAPSSLISTPGTKSFYLVPTGANQDVVVTFTGSDAIVDNLTVQLPATLGANIAPDPGFDDGPGWTLTGSGGSITGAKYVVTAVAGIRRATRAALATLVTDECYRVTWTVSGYSAGTSALEIGGAGTGLVSANGTFTKDVVTTAGSQNIAARVSTNGACSIDDLVVKKLTIS